MSEYSFSEAQVVEMESRFGLRFPAAYRRYLLDYPLKNTTEAFMGAIRESMLNAGVSGDEASEDLIENNELFREHKDSHWGFAWQDNYWWVGGDGAGGFFFIDCSDSDTPVYYLDHEEPAKVISDRELLKPCPIEEYVSSLVDDEVEWESRRQQMQEKIANRNWWQFWIPKQMPYWLR